MADRDFPLTLTIKAIDRATAPLRAINQRIQAATAPVRRLNNSFKALSDEAGLPRLVTSMKGVWGAASTVGERVGRVGARIAGMTAAALFGSYGLARLARSAMESGDRLGMMAERVGLTVDGFAQLQYAAQQADVSQEDFSAAMDQFNRRLGEAKKEGGPLLAFLNDVSPALASQVKHARNTEEALALMTGAFEKLQDPAKMAALAAAAFGKSGLQMGQFLHAGTKEIEKQRRAFFDLAGSQEEAAKLSDGLDQAVRRTGTAFTGLQGVVAVGLFPALTQLADAITKILVGQRGNLAEWASKAGVAISSWVGSGGVDRLIESMKEWGKTIGRVVDMLGGLKAVLVALGVYLFGPLAVSVLSLGGAFLRLGGAVLPIVIRAGMLLWPVLVKLGAALVALLVANPFVAIGAAIVAAALLVWKYWDPIKKFFTELWDTMKSILGVPQTSAAPTGAGASALGAAGAVSTLGNGAARVQVDFANLPKGARVTADPQNTADLDLSLGYSMVGS